MVAEFFSGFAQKNNMLVGILISALITSVFWILIPIAAFFIADIYLIVGNLLGLYLTFKNRKETQLHIKTGIIVGLVGSILGLILIGILDWLIYSFSSGFNFFLLMEYLAFLFYYFGIVFALVGLIIGYLFGNRYKKRDSVDKPISLLQ
jgi:hypothetical protein